MNIEKHLEKLYADVYPQPEDEGHTAWAKYVIDTFCPLVNTVLDVGCSTGFCEPMFLARGMKYTGCTLGTEDLQVAGEKRRNVVACDMSDLKFPDNSFDMIFARHALEHSPMPVLTLMEWQRVAKKLMLVMPAPEYWTYRGRNHYSVANKDQLWHWFDVTNWRVIKYQDFMTSDPEFMRYYMPEVKNRSEVEYPGAPVPVEYWFYLEAK